MGGIRFDLQNQLSVAQAISGASAVVSTNSYQLASLQADISIGRLMSLWFDPTVAAGAGTSCLFEVITATDAALTVNVLSIATLTVSAANLGVGYGAELVIPKGALGNTVGNTPNANQYLGARYTLTGGTTTLTVDTYLMPSSDIPKFKSFPKVVDALV